MALNVPLLDLRNSTNNNHNDDDDDDDNDNDDGDGEADLPHHATPITKMKRSWTRILLGPLLLPVYFGQWAKRRTADTKLKSVPTWAWIVIGNISLALYLSEGIVCASSSPDSQNNITSTEKWGPLVIFLFWMILVSFQLEGMHRMEENTDIWVAPLLALKCANPEVELAWVQSFNGTNSWRARYLLGSFELFRGRQYFLHHIIALHNSFLPVSCSEIHRILTTTEPSDHCIGFVHYLKSFPRNEGQYVNLRMSWVALNMFDCQKAAIFRAVFTVIIISVSTVFGFFFFGRIPVYCKERFFGITSFPDDIFITNPVYIYSWLYGGIGFSIILNSIAQMILEFSDDGCPIQALRDIAESFVLQSQRITLNAVQRNKPVPSSSETSVFDKLPFIDLATGPGLAAFNSLLLFAKDFRRERQLGANPAIFVVTAVFTIALTVSVACVLLVTSKDVLFNPTQEQMSANVFVWTGTAAIIIEMAGLLVVVLVAAVQNSKLVQLKGYLVEASTSLHFRSLLAQEQGCKEVSKASREKANQVAQMATSIDTNPISLLGFPLTFATLSALVSLLVTAVVAFVRYVNV